MRDECPNIGHDLHGQHAADVLDRVKPMRADVGDRARTPPGTWLDAPVVVVGFEQPVLEVGTEGDPQVAKTAAARIGARSTDHRIASICEGDGRVEARVRRLAPQLRRFGRVERKGLLHDHVLSTGKRTTTEIRVRGVRGADVDDIDGPVGQELLDRHDPFDAQPLCRGLRALHARSGQRHDIGEPGATRCINMVRTHEARADDADAQAVAHVHHASARAGSFGITLRRKATPLAKPSSMESRASSCSIDRTPS